MEIAWRGRCNSAYHTVFTGFGPLVAKACVPEVYGGIKLKYLRKSRLHKRRFFDVIYRITPFLTQSENNAMITILEKAMKASVFTSYESILG